MFTRWRAHRELHLATSQSHGRLAPNVWENPKILGGYRGKSKWWKSGRWKMKVVRIWIWGQRVAENNDRDRVGRWIFESFEFVSDSESGDYIYKSCFLQVGLFNLQKIKMDTQNDGFGSSIGSSCDRQEASRPSLSALAGKCTDIEVESDRVTGDCDPAAIHDTNHANQLAW